MKKLFVLAAVLAIAAVKTMASSTVPAFNISATAVFEKTNYLTSDSEIGATMTLSLNNKFVYNMISNAVATQSGVLQAHLPADGYIAYDPYDYDSNVKGFFYVTNKSNFYYQLSGTTNETYYSFMELDSDDYNLGSLGFGNWDNYNINTVSSYNINDLKNTAKVKNTETALLYIHSNPNDYDDLNNSAEFGFDEQNAIEIRGVFEISGSETTKSFSGSSTITGTGNINLNSHMHDGVLTSGKATIH